MKRCILQALAWSLSIILGTRYGESDPKDKRNSDAPSLPQLVGCDLYQFPLPKGWTYQVSGNDVSLIAENFPAWIVIQPHNHHTLEEVLADIYLEPSLEDIRLSRQINPSLLKESVVVTNFTGTVCGIPAQVRLIGTISPYEGGAFVFACTSSDECFAEVSNTADVIVSDIQYLR